MSGNNPKYFTDIRVKQPRRNLSSMIHKERIKYPTNVYPVDEWRMIERQYYPKFIPQTESFFSIGNGYIGMRGNFDEGRPCFQNSSMINGFYESWPIVYGEEAYGFAKTGQTIVNVPDCKIIKLYVDDEPFFLPRAALDRFERVLDMKSGILTRDIIWETPYGKKVSINSQRLVSFKDRHLAAISYEVTLLNADAPVAISSEMVIHQNEQGKEYDPRTTNGFKTNVLDIAHESCEDLRIIQGYTTKSSRMNLACGMDHIIETECPYTHKTECQDGSGKIIFCINGKKGKSFRIIKYIAYAKSPRTHPGDLGKRCIWTMNRSIEAGFEGVAKNQKTFMKDFWEKGDIRIKGDTQMQQAIRFNLFHMLQAAGRTEDSGVPAKGLTGLGYEGHYFWDTEIYIIPYFTYTSPRVARNLLRFRYTMLDEARKRAETVGHPGALFPWRTINGEEASSYYAAGTAQYHINADIMYALKKYVDVTGDESFLLDYGAEMLVETARMWHDLGFYSSNKGNKFCIDGVTGPDEYNTVVNNNTFTNLMARENLWYAAKVVRMMRKKYHDKFVTLRHRTNLKPGEVTAWQKAADNMYFPYDQKLKILPQDDGFLEKKKWDLNKIPPEKFPLLLHYHPLVIYRHQVIKQADVVLALFLLGNEFDLQAKKRNFDYYDKLTTGDSSLSVSIQSIIAFELGDMEKAEAYARYALMMDLGDIGGNVKSGLHMASMGGTWMAIVNGMAGMRDYDGQVSFRPKLPKKIRLLRFRLTIRGRMIEIKMEPKQVTYRLVEGEELHLQHENAKFVLSRKKPLVSMTHSTSG
jgi:alpha,alpha-trehalose phosphorylase